MTTIRSNNFDAETGLPTNWAALQGSWGVTTTNAVSGKALGTTTNAAGDAVLDRNSVLTDFVMTYDFRCSPVNTDTLQPIIRSDTTGANYYRLAMTPAGGIALIKRTASVNRTIQTSLPGILPITAAHRGTVSDQIRCEITVVGNSFEVRIWNITRGDTRPTNAQWLLTDPANSFTSGYTGFYYSSANSGIPVLDNYVLDDAPALSFPAPVAVARTDTNFFFPPAGSQDDGTSKILNSAGAYFKGGFTGPRLDIFIKGITFTGAAPTIRIWVNNAAPVDFTLTAYDVQLNVAAGLAAGNHKIRVQIIQFNSTDDIWGLGLSLRINGFLVANGQASATAALRSKRALVFSDSIGAQVAASVTGTDDSTTTFVPFLLESLDTEYAAALYPSSGYNQAGSGNVPALSPTTGTQAMLYQSSAVARVFTPEPDYIVNFHGRNGSSSATVQAFITGMRAQCPNAKIILVSDPGAFGLANITAAAAAVADANTFVIDPGSTFVPTMGSAATGNGANVDSLDGTHGRYTMHPRFAAIVSRLIALAIQPRKFTVTGS